MKDTQKPWLKDLIISGDALVKLLAVSHPADAIALYVILMIQYAMHPMERDMQSYAMLMGCSLGRVRRAKKELAEEGLLEEVLVRRKNGTIATRATKAKKL